MIYPPPFLNKERTLWLPLTNTHLNTRPTHLGVSMTLTGHSCLPGTPIQVGWTPGPNSTPNAHRPRGCTMKHYDQWDIDHTYAEGKRAGILEGIILILITLALLTAFITWVVVF